MEVRDGPIDSRIRERPRVVRQSRIPMCQEHGTHAAHSSQHRSPALPHAAVRTRSAIPAARGGLLALTNCSPGSARPADASCRGSRSRACEAEVEGDGLPSSRGREACASPHHAWDRVRPPVRPTGALMHPLQEPTRLSMRLERAPALTLPAQDGARDHPGQAGACRWTDAPLPAAGAPQKKSRLQTPRRVSAAVHRAGSCPISAPSRPGSIRSRRRACGLPCTADSRPPAPGCR